MADLDSLLDELDEKADYSDDLSSSEEPKRVKKYSTSSESESEDESEAEVVNPDEIDDILAELDDDDMQGNFRRKAPRTRGLHVIGARKTASRREVKSALDGDELDRILDEIDESARQKILGQTDKLGFGVINAERKFDLRAPKAGTVNKLMQATLFVYTQSGEKSRIPSKLIKVTVDGLKGDPELKDNMDGTYTISFKPTKVGKLVLRIDGYDKRQFDWDITIYDVPAASNCTATADETLKVNQTCRCTIYAKDAAGNQLQIGGADFKLSYTGAGQLSQVGLADKMDGTYILQFVPDTPGQYALFVTLDGKEIKDHPLVFTVKN